LKARNKKNGARAKGILIDFVKDHLIPYIAQLKTTKNMFDALAGLFESNNSCR